MSEKPTATEIQAEAERLHAAECGCHLPVSGSWLRYAEERLIHESITPKASPEGDHGEAGFPLDRGICDLCEERPVAPDDVFCGECRAHVEASCDEVTDPVEIVLSHHQHVCFLSSPAVDDRTLCRCGEVFEGGPGFWRRHQAEKVYEALGLEGPSPWVLGPESPTRQREGFR